MSTTNSHKSAKVVSELRRICSWYCPERKKAKERARVKVYLRNKDGKLGKRYNIFWKCEKCNAITEKPDVHHKNEVGKTLPYPFNRDQITEYVRRIFVPSDEYILLCKDCHKQTHREIKANVKKRAEEKNNLL